MKKFAIFALAMCLICCFAVLMGCQTQHNTGDAASGSFEGEWAEGVQSVEFLYAGADDNIDFHSYPLTEKNYRTSGILLVQGAYFNVRVTLKPGYTFGGLQLVVDGQTLEYQSDHERIRDASFRPTQETFTMSFVGASTDVTGGLSIEVDGDVQPVGNTLTVVLDRENPITVYARLGKSVAIYGDERVIECTVDNNEIVSVESSGSSDIDAKFQIFMLADGTATLTFSAGGQTYQLVIVISSEGTTTPETPTKPAEVTALTINRKTAKAYLGWENYEDIVVTATYEGENQDYLLDVSFSDNSVVELSHAIYANYDVQENLHNYKIDLNYKKTGSCTITVKAAGMTVSCNVTVVDKPAEVAGSAGLQVTEDRYNNKTAWYVTGLGTCTETDIVIPNVYDGHRVIGVKAIAYQAQNTQALENVKSVRLPEGLERLEAYYGYGAFEGLSGLESVTFSSTVKEIGAFSFEGCTSLTTLEVPGTITTIGRYAFSASAIDTITLNEGVTTIDSYAFYDCENLSVVNLPNSLTTIEMNAFSGCSDLQSITLPQSVETIGYDAFWGCDALEQIVLPQKIKSIGSYAFAYCDALKDITLPDNLTEISQCMFSNCKSLAQITIPQSVTKICSDAFYYCEKLNNVVIPNSVTEIESGAFHHCISLVELTLPQSVTKIGDKAFYNCPLNAVTLYKDTEYGVEVFDVDIKNVYVDTIALLAQKFGAFSFTGNWSDNMANCNVYVGADKTLLTGAVVVSGVEQIPEHFLCGYPKITAVSFDGVSVICEGAFGHCQNLFSVDLEGVAEVQNAFDFCDNLTYLTITESLEKLGGFYDSGIDYVDVDSLNHWLELAEDWDELGFTLTINSQPLPKVLTISGVEKIPARSLAQQSSIEEVIIEDGVKEIGNQAFYNCWAMTNITLPSTLTTIADDALDSCIRLQTINCPSNVDVSNLTLVNCPKFSGTPSEDGRYTTFGGKVFKVTDTTFFVADEDMRFYQSAFSSALSLKYLYIPNADYAPSNIDKTGLFLLYKTGEPQNLYRATAVKLDEKDLCTADGWIYQTAEDGKSVTIKGYIGGADQDGVVDVPATIDQLPVTAVTYVDTFGCFFKDGDVRKITFDSLVISVDTRTFVGLSNLEEIALSENVFEWKILCGVGNNNYIMNMFKDCTKLTSISAPENKDPAIFEYSSQAISATGDILTVVKAAALNDEQLVVTLRPQKGKTFDSLAGHTFVLYEARLSGGLSPQPTQKRALDDTAFNQRGSTYKFGDTTVEMGNILQPDSVQEFSYTAQDGTLTINMPSGGVNVTFTYTNTELVMQMKMMFPGSMAMTTVELVYVME